MERKIISLSIEPKFDDSRTSHAITIPVNDSTESAVRELMQSNGHANHATWSLSTWKRGGECLACDFALESDRAVYLVTAIERDVPHRADNPEFIAE